MFEIIVKRLKLKTQIQTQAVDLKSQTDQLNNTYKVATYYKPSIPRPDTYPDPIDEIPDETLEILRVKNILTAIRIFNPNKPNADFCEHWRRIMSYTRHHLLSEQQYFDILSLTLSGSSLRTFDDLIATNPSLDVILDRFVLLYGSKRTILDDQELKKSLTSFS